jgi:hypothetical protein
MPDWSDEETDDPYYSDDRNFLQAWDASSVQSFANSIKASRSASLFASSAQRKHSRAFAK